MGIPSAESSFAIDEVLQRSTWVVRDTTFAGQPHFGGGGEHGSPAVIMSAVDKVTLFFKYAPLS